MSEKVFFCFIEFAEFFDDVIVGLTFMTDGIKFVLGGLFDSDCG